MFNPQKSHFFFFFFQTVFEIQKVARSIPRGRVIGIPLDAVISAKKALTKSHTVISIQIS